MSEQTFKFHGRWYSAMDFLWVQQDDGGWEVYWYWRARAAEFRASGRSPWLRWMKPIPPEIMALHPFPEHV